MMAKVAAQTVNDVVQEIELKKRSFPTKHISGLPLHDGANCLVIFEEDSIIIKTEEECSKQFRLAYHKIVDFQLPLKKNVENTMVSNPGGAIAGALLFGAPGAMIGGKAKKKEIVTFEYFFIVTYKKNDVLENLHFQMRADYLKAVELVKKYRPLTACPAPGEAPVVDL